MYKIFRNFLFCFPAEFSHKLILSLMKWVYPSWRVKRIRQPLSQKPVAAFGLTFPNPVGLAAGLDKDGKHIDALFGLGVGFIEVGAVTPKPQFGNDKPRLFRLTEHKALINRFGFNNQGVDALVDRLKRRKINGIVGVNIGKNRTTSLEKAHEDYLLCYEKLYPYADFVTLNISSPNTIYLRALQGKAYLESLLQKMKDQQQLLQERHQKKTPFLVKVSPDLNDDEINEMAEIFLQYGVEGIIAVNTTKDRGALSDHPLAKQEGGLSGAPLREKTRHVVKVFAEKTQQKIPIIAVGGIFSADDAQILLSAGASLVQVYTGLIYEGPQLIHSIINKIEC